MTARRGRKIVGVFTAKGGVGKSSVAAGLASAAHSLGRSVLLIDTDVQQRSATVWVGSAHPEMLVCLAPSDVPNYLATVERDWIVIDTAGHDDPAHSTLFALGSGLITH